MKKLMSESNHYVHGNTKLGANDNLIHNLRSCYEINVMILDFVYNEFTVELKTSGDMSVELIDIIKKMSVNVEKIVKQTEAKSELPDYIDQLIENGLIKPDGITTIASLQDIADFLFKHKLVDKVTTKLLLQFNQENGKPFTFSSAQQAASRCKA